MTVGTKVHQTLVSCESAVANLKSFALDTENQQAKALYTNLAQAMEQQVVGPLRNQCNQLEQQEPQYKVYEQAQQQAQQGGQMQQSAGGQSQYQQSVADSQAQAQQNTSEEQSLY